MYVLTASLEKTIIPSFDCLKSIVGTDEKVITMLKKSTIVLRINHERKLAPKLAILHALGVPDSVVAKLLVSHPRMFTISSARFNEIVAQVKKMEFDPCQYTFLAAIQALTALSIASLEAKFDLYRSWGWSEDEIRRAFRKAPTCMLISKESIMSKMNCLVKKFGFAASYIAKQPSVLTYSYKRRIVPRCSVMQVLIKSGQLKKAPTLCTFLTMSEEMFLMKYLTRFEKEIPELKNVYLRKIKVKGIDHGSSVV
ncbi:hypothetical protein ACHQM5_019572 [Ranunculus cassubicifolius]